MNNDKEDKKLFDLKRRFIIFLVVILIVCGMFLRELVNIQIVNGQEYLDTAMTRIVTNGVIYANRGNIYDRYGVPIAGNRMGFCIQFVDTQLSNREKNELLARFIRLLDTHGDGYQSTLRNIFGRDPYRFLVNKEGFIKQISVSDSDRAILMDAEAKDVFQYMREKSFELDPIYTDEEAYRIMELRYEMLIKPAKISQPLIITEDVSIETVVTLEERSREYPGFSTFVKPFREYYDAGAISHVLGFMGNIGEQYTEWSQNYPELEYTAEDKVGISGIERAMEPILRGINGKTRKEVDTEGRLTSYEAEEAPKPGRDIYLTIDLNLQKAALDSLIRNIEMIRNRESNKNFHDANAGAVVAMDVKTGEVLAMVSYPTYDPAVFIEGNSEQIRYLYSHPDSITLNRATSGKYAPGSTYKPLVAIAALESGTITPETLVHCPSRKEIGGLIWPNLEGNQGRIKLERALETSSNMFFFQVGFDTGIDNIVKWAKNFGFGKPSGIEIGEEVGSLASREFKMKYYKEGWVPADTCNAALGQLYNTFTPVQLVNYVASIGNGGRLYRPRLVRKHTDASGDVQFTEITYQDSGAKESTIQAVQRGMVAVANSQDGTAVNIFRDFPFGDVAGKTGTAETGLEATSSSNALFLCYAPADDPQIAVAVVVEKGVWGSWTAPIARDVLMEYFSIQERMSGQ